MKTELRAGREIEFVTPDELRRVLGEVFPARRGPQTERPIASVALDSAGAGTVELFTVPAGMQFTLHRLLIDADGHSPASRITAGYAKLLQSGVPAQFFDFTIAGDGIPLYASWTSDAPVFHERELVRIDFVGSTASAVIVCRGQGTLEPLTLG